MTKTTQTLLLALFTLLAACGKPAVFDGTNEAAFKSSLADMTEPLSDNDKKKLKAALETVGQMATAEIFDKNWKIFTENIHGDRSDEITKEEFDQEVLARFMHYLDGKTVEQVIEMADTMQRKIEKAAEIEKIDQSIKDNLRQIARGAQTYILHTGHREVTVRKLIEIGYVSHPESYAGENYLDLVIHETANSLSVTTSDNRTIRHNF